MPTAARLLLALLLLTLGGCASLPAETSSPPMPASPLEVTLTPPPEPVVLGTPLFVTASVHLTAGAPLNLPTPGMGSPITYRVLSADGKTIVAEVSKVFAALAQSMGGSTPPSRPAALSPGGRLAYREDLNGYFTTPPPAGRYLLEALLNTSGGGAISPRVPFELVPLAPVTVLRLADDEGAGLDTLVLHHGAQGLRIYFGLGDRQRGVPASLRQIPAAGADPVTGIALAANTEPVEGSRWIAIQQGRTIGGGLARAFDVAFPFSGVTVDLERPRLTPRGFQSPGRACFVAVGTRDGAPALALVEVGKNPPVVRYVRLKGAPNLAVAAGWQFPEGRLQLVWSVTEAGETKLLAAALDPAAPPAELAVETIAHRTTAHVAALRVPPLLAADFDGVEWLETSPASPWPALKRWRPGQTVETSPALPETALFKPAEIERWIVPETGPVADGLVAQGAQGTWALRAGTWSPLNAPARASLALHPLAGPRLFASWWPDPRSGLATHPVP